MRSQACLSEGQAFGVFDANDTRVLARGPETVDYRGRHTALRVSDDGSVVEIAFATLALDNRWQRHLARLHLTEGQVLHQPQPLAAGVAQLQQRLAELGYNPGSINGTLRPHTRAAIRAFQQAHNLPVDGRPSRALQHALGIAQLQAPRTTGLAIRDWYNSTRPTLDGKPLPLQQYETSRGLAITPDGAHFALGTHWYIRLFDRRGTQLWVASAPGATSAVTISGDGRFVIAAFDDGTLRWYRLRDGAELLALFLHLDGKRWVLWTPEGFFHAAPGSEALIGYHLHQGPDAAGAFVTVEQLATLFSRPDLVARRLQEGIEPALHQALARPGDVRQVLAGGLPPTLQLLSPPETQQNQRDFTMKFRITDTGGGVGRVVYRVNGGIVGDPTARPLDISGPHQRRPFTLSSGRHTISATIFNARNTIESAPIEAVVHVNAEAPQPTLYVLAVGITAYRDQALHLRHAARDARDLAEALQHQGQGLFKAVKVTPLLDEAARLHDIDAAFQQLAREVQEHDVFVLYLAGHGTTLDGEYLFIPWDMAYTNQEALRAGSVRQEQLMRWLGLIKAQKSLVLLDTCYARALVQAALGESPTLFATRGLEEKAAIDRLMRATGRAMLVASTERQFALEGYDDKHGVFTSVLLQGLQGDALQGQSDTIITVDQLASYVMREVPRRTRAKWGYEQFPMQQMSGQPFAIGQVQR